MDNIETTDTKKKSKFRIFDIAAVGISALILGLSVYFKIVGGELFLFGYAWNSTDTGNFLNAFLCVWIFTSWQEQPESAKRRKVMILCAVLFVLELGLLSWSAYEKINGKADRERLVLSDGNEILLSERITHSTIGETKFEFTYMDVYQIKGIAVKKLGRIDETYFSNKCLSQDKYTYEYDGTSKKLTIICEYGTYGDGFVRLKEEYDTGFWEEEFTLQ